MEEFEKWLHPRITVEDSRIDYALLELELQRIKILDLIKQIKTGCMLHLLNHLIFM